MKTTYDVFFRAHSNDKVKKASPSQIRQYHMTAEPDLGPVEIVEAAIARGCSKGNGQTGVFEIQTDAGIWTGPMIGGYLRPLVRKDGKLDPRASFKTWDEMEALETP